MGALAVLVVAIGVGTAPALVAWARGIETGIYASKGDTNR